MNLPLGLYHHNYLSTQSGPTLGKNESYELSQQWPGFRFGMDRGAKIGCFRTVCFSVIYYHHDLKKSSTIKQPRVRWRKKNKSGASISIHPARNNFLFPLHPGTRVTKEEEFRATIMQKQRRAMEVFQMMKLHMTSPWRCGDIHTIRHLVCSIWRLVAFCAVADGEGTVGTSSSSIWKCKGLLIQDIMWMANLRWTHQDHQFWRVADNLFLKHFRWTKRRGLIHATTKSLEWGVLQGHQVEGLKWYTYHCRPSLAMIVDLFVLPGLCFQSLSTFYRSLVYGLCVWNTNKRIKMYCRIKVWPLVWARSVKVAKPVALWFQTLFYQNSAPRNTVKPKLFCFHIGIHPCLNFFANIRAPPF